MEGKQLLLYLSNTDFEMLSVAHENFTKESNIKLSKQKFIIKVLRDHFKSEKIKLS